MRRTDLTRRPGACELFLRKTSKALTALAAAALCWSAGSTLAQEWPSAKPVRVIVPFAAGSTTDIIARAISDKMSQSLGQQLVVDNRGGASGTVVEHGACVAG